MTRLTRKVREDIDRAIDLQNGFLEADRRTCRAMGKNILQGSCKTGKWSIANADKITGQCESENTPPKHLLSLHIMAESPEKNKERYFNSPQASIEEQKYNKLAFEVFLRALRE